MTEDEKYWIDSNNNKWSKRLYTKGQAERWSSSLINCINCINCRNCINCINCRNCRNCINCRNCTDWVGNPERVVSPVIGTRGDQTTIYFSAERTQVIFGCFNGTLEYFKKAVDDTHGDNEHGAAYKAWIKRVENYRGAK